MTMMSLKSIPRKPLSMRLRMPDLLTVISILSVSAAVLTPVWAFSRVLDCSSLFEEASTQLKPSSRVIVEITTEGLGAYSGDPSAVMRVPVVKIRTAQGEILLHKLDEFRAMDEANQPISIAENAQVYFFSATPDGVRHAIQVPVWLRDNLRNYIRNGPPTKPFDCNCFAHLLNGVAYKFGEFSTRVFSLHQVPDETVLRVGDTVLLGYSRSEITHVAVALGEGLFISKFGKDGPVLVTNFPTLQLTYGGMPIARIEKVIQDIGATDVQAISASKENADLGSIPPDPKSAL